MKKAWSTVYRRVPAVVLAALVLSTLGTGTAAAGAQEQCNTFNHRYHLGSGTAITLRIGHIDSSLQVCQNRLGYVTRASAIQATALSTYGSLFGFNIDEGLSSVIRQTGIVAEARFEGRIRICIAQRTPICSQSYPYTVTAWFSPAGPALHDRSKPVWLHAPTTPGGVQYYVNP